MNLLKKTHFWISLVVGAVLFAVTFPFYHDMYIAPLFTVICICLNGASALLFAGLLYCMISGNFRRENAGTFLWFLVLQGIGHGIFAMMNWGAWLFLGLTVASLIWMAIVTLKHKL